jgi:hypothetical protein
VRRLALAAVLPGLALGAAGCGAASTSSGSFEGARGDVAQVVTDLSSAGRRKDADKICTDLLSRSLQQRMRAGTSDCVSEVDKAADDADDFELSVRSVAVTGDRAQAQVRQGADGPVTRFTFVRENGSWRISGLG